MIKCLIVDDEPLAQEVIERYILRTSELQLVQKCSNVIEAFTVLENESIDLIFLDIKMPVINGMDFIKSLPAPPAIIFTTAFSGYAVDSYEMEAVDYLLKPVTFSRFKKSVARFLKQNRELVLPEKEYLYIKTGGRLVKVLHADIIYAESMKDYIKIVTTTGKYITHLTMKSLAALLPLHAFTRVHRSFIVHSVYIKSIGKKEIAVNEFNIPVGDNYRVNLKEWGRTENKG